MATDKPRFSLTIDDEMLAVVEKYRKDHGISTRSKAIQRLVEAGLDDLTHHGSLPIVRKAPSVSDEALQVARRYDGLEPDGKGAVRAILDYAESVGLREVPQEAPAIIRHYLHGAAAGVGGYVDGEDYEDMPLPPDAPADADFCISVSGDSMEPYLHDGQIVYVRRNEPLRDFEVGVFAVDGETYIKQIARGMDGSVYLLSANPARQDANIEVRPDGTRSLYYIGKVLLKQKLPQPVYD